MKGELMGFWNLLNRRRAQAEPPAGTVATAEPEPLSPAERADLEGAWRELNQTLGDFNVMSFRACGRDGRHWSEDPAAVRAIAATVRSVVQEHAQDLPEGRRLRTAHICRSEFPQMTHPRTHIRTECSQISRAGHRASDVLARPS